MRAQEFPAEAEREGVSDDGRDEEVGAGAVDSGGDGVIAGVGT